MKNQITHTKGRALATGAEWRLAQAGGWSGLVSAFIADQDVRDSSREVYARTLSQFFRWASGTGRTLAGMTRADILQYKDYQTKRGLSPLTVGGYLVAVRKFYGWAESEHGVRNIACGVKTPKKRNAFRKEHLRDSESADLLRHFGGGSLRDFAIVNLMLRTGLRTIEVVRADIGDISLKGGRRILRVWGKGRDGKEDFVVLTEKAYGPVARYLSEERRAARAGEPLFVSESRQNRGGRLSTRTVSGICKGGLRAIGLDGREYTAHSLRHTAAVAIQSHSDTGNIMEVQRVLRHNSPVTSQIYTQSAEEEWRLANAPEYIIDRAF